MEEKSKEILEKVENSLREGKKVELEDSYGYTDKGFSNVYCFTLDNKEEYNLLDFCFEVKQNIEERVFKEVIKLENDAFDIVLHKLGFEFNFHAETDKLVNKYTSDDEHRYFILCPEEDKLVYIERCLKQFYWKYTGGKIRTWSFKFPSLSALEERIRKALEAKKEGEHVSEIK